MSKSLLEKTGSGVFPGTRLRRQWPREYGLMIQSIPGTAVILTPFPHTLSLSVYTSQPGTAITEMCLPSSEQTRVAILVLSAPMTRRYSQHRRSRQICHQAAIDPMLLSGGIVPAATIGFQLGLYYSLRRTRSQLVGLSRGMKMNGDLPIRTVRVLSMSCEPDHDRGNRTGFRE